MKEIVLKTDKKFKIFDKQRIHFVETLKIQEGVVCDVYNFVDSPEKDLGIIRVFAGAKTPLQEIIRGDKTIERFISGAGTLTIIDNDEKVEYKYPGGPENIVVKVGQFMQWKAKDNLIFAEICYPPYEEGRFRNIDEK